MNVEEYLRDWEPLPPKTGPKSGIYVLCLCGHSAAEHDNLTSYLGGGRCCVQPCTCRVYRWEARNRVTGEIREVYREQYRAPATTEGYNVV